MAGHSHSANIAVRKNAQDKARARLFTKLMKEVYVAVKMGGPDPESNSRLRAAITRAKAQSVPKDKILRAIKKSEGSADDANFEETIMEGYGPGGSAVLVRCLTDNRNRTAANIRHAFAKHGGNFGTSGCVSYMFQRKGVIFITNGDEDEVMMAALDAGAEDVAVEDGGFEVLCDPDDFEACLDQLKDVFEFSTAEVMMIPDTRVSVAGEDATRFLKMLEALNDEGDVQAIHHNAEIATDALVDFAGS